MNPWSCGGGRAAIAPAGFGVPIGQPNPTEGREGFGWKESPGFPDRPPFPIRMVDNVDIIGVTVNQARPVIWIDEIGAGATYIDWIGYPFDPVAEPGRSQWGDDDGQGDQLDRAGLVADLGHCRNTGD